MRKRAITHRKLLAYYCARRESCNKCEKLLKGIYNNIEELRGCPINSEYIMIKTTVETFINMENDNEKK